MLLLISPPAFSCQNTPKKIAAEKEKFENITQKLAFVCNKFTTHRVPPKSTTVKNVRP